MMEAAREMNFIRVMKFKNDESSSGNELHRGDEVQKRLKQPEK